MTAGHYDLNIEQGTDWSQTFHYLQDDEITPIDLTNYTARAEFRVLDTDGVTKILKSALTMGDGITIIPESGAIILAQTKAQTEAYDFSEGEYDLLLSSPTNTQRLLKGRIIVDKSTTQPEETP